jgi:aminopeptidase N
MWIHEGFGQYSEVIYLEELYGRESADKYLNGLKRGIENKEPVIGPYGVNKVGSGHMYPKGASFLNTLRNYINNDMVWWDIVASIQKEYYHKNISTEDVLNLMNRKSGKNLKPLFDTYLRQGQLPALNVELKEQNRSVLIKYNWENTAKGFDLSIKVKVKGTDEVYTLTPDKNELLLVNTKKDQLEFDKSSAYYKLEMK